MEGWLERHASQVSGMSAEEIVSLIIFITAGGSAGRTIYFIDRPSAAMPGSVASLVFVNCVISLTSAGFSPKTLHTSRAVNNSIVGLTRRDRSQLATALLQK